MSRWPGLSERQRRMGKPSNNLARLVWQAPSCSPLLSYLINRVPSRARHVVECVLVPVVWPCVQGIQPCIHKPGSLCAIPEVHDACASKQAGSVESREVWGMVGGGEWGVCK